MRRNYTRRSIVNTDGYKDTSPNRDNPINIIEGSNITMDGVSIPITATPVYSNGEEGESIRMYPGQDYKFEEAEYVKENKFQQGGEMNKFDKYFTGQFRTGGIQTGLNFDPNKYRPQFEPTDPVELMEQQGTNYMEPTPNIGQFQPEQGFIGKTPYGQAAAVQPMKLESSTPYINMDSTEEPQAEQQQEYNQGLQTYQYANPYGGVDTEGAAAAIGEGFADGNYAKAIAGIGKVGVSLGRNIYSGRAAAKQRNRQRNDYFAKQQKLQRVNPDNSPTMQTGGRFSTKFNK